MVAGLNAFAQHVHDWAKRKGWWDEGKHKTFGEQIALFHSELSEALEEHRNGMPPTLIYWRNTDGISGERLFDTDKPEGIPIELADVIIRICDTAAYYGIDLQEALTLKMEYNERREHRHGGKLL